MNQENIIPRAATFATQAHMGQVRKWTGEPYIRHPEAVAGRLLAANYGPHVVAAGWLHDVLEDCEVDPFDLECKFGPAVRMLVERVTKPNVPQIGAAASIKLADIGHNCKNIADVAPADDALAYLQEKHAQIFNLQLGSSVLWMAAQTAIEDGLRKLGGGENG